MINVKEDVERIIKGDNREYTASVCFNFLSCKVPESIKIKAPNAVKGCVPDQIVYPYLSHIKNRFFTRGKTGSIVFPETIIRHTDGALHRVKKSEYSRIGYIGERAEASGNVNDVLTFYFEKTNIKKITLITNPGRIIIDGQITAKDIGGNILKQKSITGNSHFKNVIDFEAERVSILELKIIKHTPNKRIWITAFYPGFEFFVNEKDIIKIKHKKSKTENKEGSIGRVYINTLEMELNNIKRLYDDKNTKSPIAGHFNSNAVCSCVFNLKTKKEPFILDLGSFFVCEIINAEDKPTVTVKAQDYIGANKNKYLQAGILDETNVMECFCKVAAALNLSASKIDRSLKNIKLKRFPLNGQAGSLLNKLAALSNSFVSCDNSGSALIAVPLMSRHGTVRYPARYFFLNEYKGSAAGQKQNSTPNVINLSYNNFEYEGEYHAVYKKVIIYKNYPHRVFPKNYENIEFYERPIGAGSLPSLKFSLPLKNYKHFAGIEFSDPLIPKMFEYEVNYKYENEDAETSEGKTVSERNLSLPKPVEAEIRLWNFLEREEYEQLTVMIMERKKPADILLKKDEFIVPKKQAGFEAPPPAASLNTGDAAAVEKRNEKNTPFEFKIELKDAVNIGRVEIANRFLQGKFEFAYTKTAEGIAVKVWNYLPLPQTVTVNIYGSKLVAGKEKKTITARNTDDIRANGEIIKNIEAGSLADDATAIEVLNSAAFYYRHFQTDFSVQTWSDPRLQLYDLTAFKSLRGFGFTQGIIEEMETEFKGFLTQKLKIRKTKKHNRDCRLFGGFAVNDRPVMTIDFLKYV